MNSQPSEQDDVQIVAAWMHHLAVQPLDGPPAIDPTVLWWKAQLLRRWDAERQATAPIEVGERVQIGLGILGTVAAIAWLWPKLPATASGALLISVVILASLFLVTAAALSAWDVIRHD